MLHPQCALPLFPPIALLVVQKVTRQEKTKQGRVWHTHKVLQSCMLHPQCALPLLRLLCCSLGPQGLLDLCNHQGFMCPSRWYRLRGGTTGGGVLRGVLPTSQSCSVYSSAGVDESQGLGSRVLGQLSATRLIPPWRRVCWAAAASTHRLHQASRHTASDWGVQL